VLFDCSPDKRILQRLDEVTWIASGQVDHINVLKIWEKTFVLTVMSAQDHSASRLRSQRLKVSDAPLDRDVGPPFVVRCGQDKNPSRLREERYQPLVHLHTVRAELIAAHKSNYPRNVSSEIDVIRHKDSAAASRLRGGGASLFRPLGS
jgi:hypothetical protein